MFDFTIEKSQGGPQTLQIGHLNAKIQKDPSPFAHQPPQYFITIFFPFLFYVTFKRWISISSALEGEACIFIVSFCALLFWVLFVFLERAT